MTRDPTRANREHELRAHLVALAVLLEGVAEFHWAAKAREAGANAELEAGEVLSWFGSMGSISDLIVARVNGHRIECAEEATLNDKLDELRSQIYKIASELHRSRDFSSH